MAASTGWRPLDRRHLWVALVAGVCLAGWIAGKATPGATAVSWHGASRRVETLRAGERAPAFTLRERSGPQVRLSDSRGAPLALVFTSPDCPYCKDLVGRMRMAGVPFKAKVAVRFISSTAAGHPSWFQSNVSTVCCWTRREPWARSTASPPCPRST